VKNLPNLKEFEYNSNNLDDKNDFGILTKSKNKFSGVNLLIYILISISIIILLLIIISYVIYIKKKNRNKNKKSNKKYLISQRSNEIAKSESNDTIEVLNSDDIQNIRITTTLDNEDDIQINNSLSFESNNITNINSINSSCFNNNINRNNDISNRNGKQIGLHQELQKQNEQIQYQLQEMQQKLDKLQNTSPTSLHNINENNSSTFTHNIIPINTTDFNSKSNEAQNNISHNFDEPPPNYDEIINEANYSSNSISHNKQLEIPKKCNTSTEQSQ